MINGKGQYNTTFGYFRVEFDIVSRIVFWFYADRHVRERQGLVDPVERLPILFISDLREDVCEDSPLLGIGT